MQRKYISFLAFNLMILFFGCPLLGGEWSYYIHDHLGNTRVVLDEKGDIKEYYDYYPYGMTQRENIAGVEKAKYKFTGKELDEEGELDWYWFNPTRFYAPAIGRFLGPDPLAQKYPSLSPYIYATNNPFKFIDSDGRDVKISNSLQSSRSWQTAQNLLMYTQLGQQAWQAMVRDPNILVVFFNMPMKYYYGYQLPPFWSSDGVILPSGEIVEVEGDKRKLVMPVSISDQSLQDLGTIEYSETIFHESEAHILSRDFSRDPSDPLYGESKMSVEEEHKIYGRKSKEEPEKGSKAEEYLKQAKEAWEQFKKNEEEK